jgi:pyruvate/2-oxoglutarate dehydrogenase complex dihydrolipoamide dehydrogenase (E3) component
MVEHTDVIGMGPGGEEVAGRLAQAGLDVTGTHRSGRDSSASRCPVVEA